MPSKKKPTTKKATRRRAPSRKKPKDSPAASSTGKPQSAPTTPKPPPDVDHPSRFYRVHVIAGQNGAGKTWRLARAVRRLAAQLPRAPIFIHDQRGRMDGAIGRLAHPDALYDDVPDLLSRGLIRDERGARFTHRVNTLWRCQPDDVCELALAWIGSKRVSPHEIRPIGTPHSPIIVVLDEMDLCANPLRKKDALFHLLHYGRLAPCCVVGTFRQPQHVDKLWLSQADRLDLFTLSTRQVLDQIRESGWPGAAEIADRLPLLPDFAYHTICKGTAGSAATLKR